MICNQSSVNRGLFRSAFSHTYSDNQEKDNQFETPEFRKCACRRHDCNDKIDIDGFINPGSKVSNDDIINGKTAVIKKSDFAEENPNPELGWEDIFLETSSNIY